MSVQYIVSKRKGGFVIFERIRGHSASGLKVNMKLNSLNFTAVKKSFFKTYERQKDFKNLNKI